MLATTYRKFGSETSTVLIVFKLLYGCMGVNNFLLFTYIYLSITVAIILYLFMYQS